MITRREMLQVSAATAAIMAGAGSLSRAFAQQKLTQDDLLKFDSHGNVTLLHVTDIHGQLMPVYFREPTVNVGVGEAKGQPPHVTGAEFLKRFGIARGSADAYALTDQDFTALARNYGKIGGLDRCATVVKQVRAERGDKLLLLDGGDTWQGSLGANASKGQDMADCMALLKPDAMTGHWEFTYGEDRVKELVDKLGFSFLALNVRDTEWNEPVFDAFKMFERGGVKIAVLGQAFPYTPVANPRWMIPKWSFGIREEEVRTQVEKARKAGAQLVVLLSHNGFDVDRKLAARVEGIDVILTGHTHDALPEAIKVGNTLLIASGSHGKFISRLDLDVQGGAVKGFRYKLIPLFADVIKPDAEMSAAIEKARAPYAKDLARVVGQADSLLYRRGNFNGTFDDLICAALLKERDAEIALSPGFRWGTSVLPGSPITVEDIHNATAITYPQVYRQPMTGQRLKEVLEDVADNLFNPDPYYQQGGDMVRCGGLGYSIDVSKPIGSRISGMTLLKTGQPIDPAREYTVAGWASVNEGTQGPPVWDLVERYVAAEKTVRVTPNTSVKITGA
ncbi:thiosulfohydrolase SoxB [Pseudolabrys sp. Root1462]|uniref:thiosulfohydrolase SoxB n=1 Tax=Pseudolabrys sp. Root1462 TaxID=1736466 RepID=UPI00070386CE|nr:thiosulfohydrolase SoxB [Pseudolabrys sp. Root1462]KQZ00773.1 thiosulfohydrolase SoxB [Pseudolabrys sp. Root1462]